MASKLQMQLNRSARRRLGEYPETKSRMKRNRRRKYAKGDEL